MLNTIQAVTTPGASSSDDRTELTWRGLALGVLITLIFTAANAYFGLKAGLTFATSIPAAVISMALLRGVKGSTVQENNIVQTVASCKLGTLSSIIFVLPGSGDAWLVERLSLWGLLPRSAPWVACLA